jgi:glycosyltransferase involved in cell wall biosynthesis
MKNTSKPLVSIIITCYNYADFVQDAIESVDSQDYPFTEIIVVDDGSTDKSAQKIKDISKKIPLTYLFQKNAGPSSARTSGLEASKGKYIIFLDADDKLGKDYIKSNVNLSISKNIPIVYTNFRFFGDSRGKSNLPEFKKDYLYISNYIHASSLIHKKVFEYAGFDKALNRLRFDDWDFYLSAIDKGCTAILNREVFLHYRVKKSSRSTDITLEKFIKAFTHITSKYRKKNRGLDATFSNTDYFLQHLQSTRLENANLANNLAELTAIKKQTEAELKKVIDNLQAENQRLNAIIHSPVKFSKHAAKFVLKKVKR